MTFSFAITLIGICRAVTIFLGVFLAFVALVGAEEDSSLLAFIPAILGVALIAVGVRA